MRRIDVNIYDPDGWMNLSVVVYAAEGKRFKEAFQFMLSVKEAKQMILKLEMNIDELEGLHE